METLSLIYYCKAGLGFVAGLICVAGWVLTDSLFSSVFQGASFAIIFYIITYYILKMKFVTKVEKPSKLLTTGIGVYFMTWIVSWILLTSLIISFSVPTALFVPPSNPTVGVNVTFNATGSYATKGHSLSYSWFFGDSQSWQVVNSPLINHTYTTAGVYSVSLYVTDSTGLISSTQTVLLDVKT